MTHPCRKPDPDTGGKLPYDLSLLSKLAMVLIARKLAWRATQDCNAMVRQARSQVVKQQPINAKNCSNLSVKSMILNSEPNQLLAHNSIKLVAQKGTNPCDNFLFVELPKNMAPELTGRGSSKTFVLEVLLGFLYWGFSRESTFKCFGNPFSGHRPSPQKTCSLRPGP